MAKIANSGRPQLREYKPRPLTEEDYKAEAARSSRGSFDSIFKDGYDIYKVRQGVNTIRHMPPTWDGAKHYTYPIWTHDFVGINKGSYVCIAKMLGKRCPICELSHAAERADEKEEAYQLKAKPKFVCWVLDRMEEADKQLPLLYAQGPRVKGNIVDLTDTPFGLRFVHDPDTGYDVTFKRKGTTMTNTEYSGYLLDPESSPLSENPKRQREMLNFIENNPVPECLLIRDAAYLKQAMEGTAEDTDELDSAVAEESNEDDAVPFEEEVEQPVRTAREARGTGRAAPAKLQRKPDPADDDSFEFDEKTGEIASTDDDDFPDDDDEQPVAAKAKPKGRVQLEPPDDDEPEERPARSMRAPERPVRSEKRR